MKEIHLLLAIQLLMGGLFAQAPEKQKFSESEMILNTATGNIYGSLVVPENVKTSPVVLIIAGSGPTDRNANSTLGIQTNTYKMIAEELAANGISSLRFDKRGIAQSSEAMTSESDLRFETYINDAADWVSLLKKDKRFSSVIILGHSEGSLIGMIVAEKANVAKYISVAGVGIPADQILKEQLKAQLPPQLMAESNNILDSLKAGKTVKNVPPTLAALYRPSVQPYMISWIKYDPAKEIAKLKIPVLIVQGTTDIQVAANNAQLLAAAKPDARLLMLENMNHILKESVADIQENMATYKNPSLPLKDGLAAEIIRFIKTGK